MEANGKEESEDEPEDLAKVERDFTGELVAGILAGGREVIAWIKTQL